MFTVQWQDVTGQSRMQEYSTKSRLQLLLHLARFPHPILAVYEQASPITKTMQSQLRTYPGSIGKHARDFAFMSQA